MFGLVQLALNVRDVVLVSGYARRGLVITSRLKPRLAWVDRVVGTRVTRATTRPLHP